jgi:hypothetical protein
MHQRPNLGKEMQFSALCWYTGLGRLRSNMGNAGWDVKGGF